MKANELRIGNFYDNNGFVSVVSPNTIEEVWNAERSWVKPIPLTEEWLVKFGFVKHKTTDIYPTFAKQMFNWNDGILYIIGYGFMNHIKHVHQLQNLYFALTGEELIINN